MKAKHVFVAGSSGGGKTTYAREMHAEHDGISVWINHNDTSGVSGKRVRGRQAMDSAVQSCRSDKEVRNLRLNYRCSDPYSAGETVKNFAQDVAKHFGGDVCVQVVLDEAHNGLPDDEGESSVGSGNPYAWMLHEGRGYNVKLVPMTQDPSEIYYPPIKNCKYLVWVGEVKTWHSGFLRYWKLQNLDLPTDDWEYVVIKPTKPPEIVHRAETKEEFA